MSKSQAGNLLQQLNEIYCHHINITIFSERELQLYTSTQKEDFVAISKLIHVPVLNIYYEAYVLGKVCGSTLLSLLPTFYTKLNLKFEN